MTVQSVEMRDVIIPESLQDATSREAQAAREKESSHHPRSGRVRSPTCSAKASQRYEGNSTALHLRAMNILYEGLKEKGVLMLIPSTAVESMGLGGMLGAPRRGNRRSSGTVPARPVTVPWSENPLPGRHGRGCLVFRHHAVALRRIPRNMEEIDVRAVGRLEFDSDPPLVWFVVP